MLNQNDITQQIFDSISIIVENRLAGLSYDKTIICTVVDNSNAKNNIYTVTDGNIRFEANGQGNKYNINDSVRVEIPSGDWKQTKYIQGKHSTENDLKPVTYVSPIDSILKLTDNLIDNLPTDLARRSLRANQGPDLNKPTELKLCTINISDDVKNADIFNSIYLQADFQTDLDQYQIRSGDYGLLFVLNSADGSTTQALKFSATEHMFGNPYAFKIYTTQAKTYELSATNWSEGISSITVYLYEDNNFTYYNDATQTIEAFPKDGIDNVKINNIKVQNLILGFGSQIYNIKDNEIKIYTDNTDTFTVAGQDPEDPEIKSFKLLWYNKTEDNKYIGFSDGKASDFTDKDNNTQNYLQYDEIAYRQLVKKDNRLLAQKSDDYYDDELSLSIAADRIDISKLVQSSAKIIQGELYRELRGLYKWTKNMFKADESDTIIDEMIKTDENADTNISLSKLAASLTENSEALSTYYLNALKAAKDPNIVIDNQINDIHNGILVPIQTVFTLFGYDYSTDKLVLKAATDDIQDVFPTLKKLIEEQYVSYEDIYTSYKTRIDLLLNKIFNNYEEINKLLGIGDDNSNAAQLESLIAGEYNYEAENAYVSSSDNEEYNNRYCIYWYRENLTHTDPDSILPAGWERVTSQNNKGLPSEDTDNPGYLQARAGAAACEITFNRYIQKEKIKAVLFYNHEQFESNILEFSNTANVVDTSAIDKNGALYIEHYNSIDGKQSHSKDSYQLYDTNGLLINAAETQYKRELRVRFDGETGKDEQLIGATVYWYVPKNATLLEVFDSEVQDFHTDRVKEYSSLTAFKNACKRDLISNYASYLVQVNKHEDDGESSPENAEWRVYVVSTTFNEYDKSYLALNQLRGDNNTDKTKIYLVQDSSNPLVYKKYKYNETVDEWEEDTSGTDVERFTMTSYGETKPNDIEARLANSRMYKPGYNCYFKTIGATKVKVESEDVDVVKVEDTIFTYHIKDYYNQTFTQNTIYCQVVKDETSYYADRTFAFSSFGNSGTDYTLTLLPDLEQNVITIDHPLDVNMTLYDYNNHKIDVPLTQENPFSWKGPSGYGGLTSLRTDSNNIIGVKIEVPNSENHNCYAGILECTIKNIEIKQLNNKKVNLISYLPIPYSENLNSYIEGTTTIIYDSLGANPYYYKTPYKLFNALQNIEISDVIWSIEYYCNEEKTWTYYNGEAEQTISFTKFTINEDGNATVGELVLLPEALTNDDGNAERIAKQQKLLQELSLNYLLKLNTIDNTVIPCVMYIDNLNIYPVVIAKKDDNVLWAQPILIIKNRYASPMLNAWDGSLEINEEKNTIMSMMMGAGRKNNNNQFEGVLMGDVRTGTGDDATATGLYGFHEGAQSFGFKIDGTAFLGKSGKGQIKFNGNNGIIESGNYISTEKATAKEPASGMKIDLSSGHIDAYNFKLTSGNFILNSNGQNNYNITGTEWKNLSDIILGVNNKFALTKNGDLYANNVNLSGIIHAKEGGTIGGWKIDKDKIYSGTVGMSSSDDEVNGIYDINGILSYKRFFAGEEFEYYPGNQAQQISSTITKAITKPSENIYSWTYELPTNINPTHGTYALATFSWDASDNTGMNYFDGDATVNIENKTITIFAPKNDIDNFDWDNETLYVDYIFYQMTNQVIAPAFTVTSTGDFYAQKGIIGGWMIDNVRTYYAPNDQRRGLFYRNKNIDFEKGEKTSGLYEGEGGTGTYVVFWAGCQGGTPWEVLHKIDTKVEGYENYHHYQELTPFYVKNDGYVYCSNLNIGGGQLSSIQIGDVTLQNNNESCLFDVPNSKNLKLQTANAYIELGGEIVDYSNTIQVVAEVKFTANSYLSYHDVYFYLRCINNEGVETTCLTDHNITILCERYLDGEKKDDFTKTLSISAGETTSKVQASYRVPYPWKLTTNHVVRVYGSNNASSSYVDCDVDRESRQPVYYYVNTNEVESSKNGNIMIKGHLIPGESCHLGSSSNSWEQIWEKNGQVQGSDRNIKKDIQIYSDKYNLLFDALRPVRFKWIENESDRYHTGFIAQEVENAIKQADLDTKDFAGFIQYQKDDGDDGFGLRYTEFISLNTWQIQKLKPRMSEAEERIYKLEQELKELKAQLL